MYKSKVIEKIEVDFMDKLYNQQKPNLDSHIAITIANEEFINLAKSIHAEYEDDISRDDYVQELVNLDCNHPNGIFNFAVNVEEYGYVVPDFAQKVDNNNLMLSQSGEALYGTLKFDKGE
ncbi:hypothetical protein MOO44_01755 [Nicoliella spurrieriana]|uniref:Uncharacterized protein n=1 Tax=Nicoliella spurrieriana TaxID=2925830 RepID=A0A976X5U3_9LACO|nr:hypothetical protein [Nicoliella spurrieriana]UQS86927.1 hypothetical protein MOO44_01755 [Nicoliella spurrieriana]